MAYGAFGDIRALLHDAPSRGAWEKLCAEVRLWREPELSQVVFPYVLSQLERWPDPLRVIRPDWAKDLLRGRARGSHFTALARTLIVEDATPTDAQWDNLADLDWRSLHHVRLETVEHSGSFLARLHDASHTSNLRSMYLGAQDLAGAIGTECARGTFENLHELHLVGSSPTEDDLLDFAIADWPNLEHLTIRHSDRTTLRGPWSFMLGTLEPLAAELQAPRLRRLDIATLQCSIDATEELLRAPWLQQLTHLALDFEYAINTSSWGSQRRFRTALEHIDFSTLEHLRFARVIDPDTISALSRNPTLSNLRTLRIEERGHGWYSASSTGEAVQQSTLPEAVKAEWRDGVANE